MATYNPTIVENLNKARAAAQQSGKSTTAGNLADYDTFAAANPLAPPSVVTGVTPAAAYKDLGLGEMDFSYDNALDSALQNSLRASRQNVDPDNIFRSTLKQYQAQTDAANNIFAAKMEELNQDKTAAVGRARAMEAAGLGGYGGIVTATKNANRPIDTAAAEQEMRMAAITNAARAAAQAETESRKQAKLAGQDDYLAYLKEANTRRDTRAEQIAELAISQGLTIDQIDPSLFAEAKIPESVFRTTFFKKQKELEDAAKEEQFNAAKEQLVWDGEKYVSTAPVDPVTLSDGAFLVDPVTGEIIADNPEDFAPDPASLSSDSSSWADLIRSGGAKLSDVPAEDRGAVAAQLADGPPVVSDTTKSILSNIDQLIGSEDGSVLGRNTNAIAGVPSFGAAFGFGPDVYTSNIAKQLAGLLTLENRQLLKGSGAISDFEARVLERAASDLGLDSESGRSRLTNADFVEALKKLRNELKGGNSGESTLSPEEEDALQREGFSMVGNTSASTRNPGAVMKAGLAKAFNLLKQEEGLRTEAYQDQTGKWTIGFGNTKINGRPVRPGDKITPKQALALMQQSVVKEYTSFKDKVRGVTPNMFAALTSFEYNLGPGVWQKPDGRKILGLLNAGRTAEAGRLMLQYNKSRDPNSGQLKVNPVLAKRRAREANLLLS